MRDPVFPFERGDDFGDEVLGGYRGAVGQDEVAVAAFGFAATVAADDDAFDVGVNDAFGVGSDDGGDVFDFGAGDLELKFVVVFKTDLLHAAERLPALLDDVIKIAPVFVVVEVAGCQRSDSPNFVEKV